MYPFITHCRAATPVPKSRPMVGKAMLTIVASSAEIPEPSTVTASTHRPGVEEYAQVQQILHAADVGDGQRAAEVAGRDVAEADAADQALLARRHHGGELVIEVLAGRGVVHEAQVDDGEVVDGQAAQVVLDSLPELGRAAWPAT